LRGGRACQRARCSYRRIIAVSSPSSVGMLPSRLLTPKFLETITQHPSETHRCVKWRERVSMAVVLSHCRHPRQQSQLCRDASLQIVAVHAAADDHTAASPIRDTSACQVEGARVNGCRALTMPVAPSAIQPLSGCFPPDMNWPHSCRGATSSHTVSGYTHISSGGSACQRVSCSHSCVILIIRV
jgi:hypothetical protein